MSKTTIKDRVLFITGANRKRGIGQALVEEALKRGANKVYATARKIKELDDLVARHQGKVVPIELDVTQREQIQASVETASDTQILINNAGVVGFSGCTKNYNESLARLEMEVNYFGPLHLINAFTQKIINNGHGAIANVISIAGLLPSPRNPTYGASKAACHSLTIACRIELHPHGIPVFGVYPGPIETDMTDGLDVNKGTPQEVAKRVFNGMEEGNQNITTDYLSDYFQNSLKIDPEALAAVKREFDKFKQ